MVNYAFAVCMLVISFQLYVVLPASYNDERILDKGNAATTDSNCPANPVCNLTSLRCKTNSDCNTATPVCCSSTQGIRCCNAATQAAQPRICPASNPPPACRSADVCTNDSQCFNGEICCRTYFAGRLLNFSCCVSAARGRQCPAAFNVGECLNNGLVCGGNSECPANRVCCEVPNIAPATRCCVYPRCADTITSLTQCNLQQGVCDQTVGCAGNGRTCCHVGTTNFAACCG